MRDKNTENGAGNATGFRVFDWMRDVTVAGGLTGKGTAVAFALTTMQRKSKVDAALVETIANRAHLTKRSAERGLVELRKAGLVKVTGRYGRTGQIASAFTLLETGAWAASKSRGDRQYGGHRPAILAVTRSANMADRLEEEHKRPSRPHYSRPSATQRMAEQAARERERREQREAAAKCRYWTGQVPCNVCGAENLASCLPTTTVEPERNRP